MDFKRDVEDFMYNQYISSYKSKLQITKCPLNNEKYTCDKRKLIMLSTQLEFELDLVEIKPSKIHGNGVFAKKNIKKDELITFYPGDIINYQPNGDRHIPGHITMAFSSQRFEEKFGNPKSSDDFNNDYGYDIDGNYTIMGCPYFTNDSNYMGHFINDGAKSNSTKKSDELYNKISYLKQNCRFYNCKGGLHVAILATRDIVIGEELFIMYGTGYWESYNNKK